MEKKIKLLNVKVIHTLDESPDTSCIGQYTDRVMPGKGQIIRVGEHYGEFLDEMDDENFDMPESRRECRFFIPYAGGIGPEEEDFKKYALQDFNEMESLNNGEWFFMGIFATAEVLTPSGMTQYFRSGGLWGIQSNSEFGYLSEVAEEEIKNLQAELKSFNIPLRGFKKMAQEAIDNPTEKF
jgi:hypothetical protein